MSSRLKIIKNESIKKFEDEYNEFARKVRINDTKFFSQKDCFYALILYNE